MENEKKQPIRKVTSWHLKVEYIDATGEVYSKGKPTGTKVEQTEEDLGWLATNGYDKEGNVLTMTGAAATPNPEVQNKKSKEEELSARVDELQSLLNKF